MIHLVDSAVFPEELFQVFIVNESPPIGNPQFGFAYNATRPDRSFYLIYAHGLKEYLEAGKDFDIHCMLELETLTREYQKGIIHRFTEEEFLLGASVHEVRHRMQFCSGVQLFDPSHTFQISRCQFWTNVQAKAYENDPNGSYEFDAKFFEHYAAHEFKQDRLKLNREDLRNLINMTVEQFLEREKNR